MFVKDLFTQLSLNELSNLSMSNDGSGEILVADQPKLIRYINQGLKRLYARFVLKENDILVQLYDHITNYHLLPRFAVNYVSVDPGGFNDNEPIRYLLDLPREPFRGDVIRILSVFDSEGHKMPLNDDAAAFSLFLPQADTLQVPNPEHGMSLSVHYQANHHTLSGDLEERIHIPVILEEALTAFVAYKVLSHMNTAEMTSKSQEHMGIFNAVCSEATTDDLVNSSRSTTSTKFGNRGWV